MRKDLVVFRCKDCIEELKEYNPYIDSEGNTIPLDKIEVIEVDKYFCENYELNFRNDSQIQAPICLVNAPEKPWRIKCWVSIYDREQGNSTIYGEFYSFAEAKAEISNASYTQYWAAYEIQLTDGEEYYTIYNYANCRPLADEFVKVVSTKRKNMYTRSKNRCNLYDRTGEREYKVYIHYEGCIPYVVEAKNDMDAEKIALGLYADENPEELIKRVVCSVGDCENYSG